MRFMQIGKNVVGLHKDHEKKLFDRKRHCDCLKNLRRSPKSQIILKLSFGWTQEKGLPAIYLDSIHSCEAVPNLLQNGALPEPPASVDLLPLEPARLDVLPTNILQLAIRNVELFLQNRSKLLYLLNLFTV